VPYTNSLEQSPKPASINLQKWFLSPTGRLNLGFIRGKTYRCAHHTFLLGLRTGLLAPPSSTVSSYVAGEKEDFCKGSLSLPIFYFVIVLLTFFTLFLFASFYKKYKKIVPL
jgi:hypothetical protein